MAVKRSLQMNLYLSKCLLLCIYKQGRLITFLEVHLTLRMFQALRNFENYHI